MWSIGRRRLRLTLRSVLGILLPCASRGPLGLGVGVFAAGPAELDSHALSFPAADSIVLDRWRVEGSAQLKPNGVQLNPGVVDKVGLLWSKSPIDSTDFEVTLRLKADVEEENWDGGSFDYDGVAFWYVHDGRYRVSRKRRPAETLFGYTGLYDGLGVFLYFDAGSPMLTAAPHSSMPGVAKIARDDILGSGEGVGMYDAFLSRKNPEKEATIKIRVRPDRADIEVVGQRSITVEGSFRPGGYFGITSLSASISGGPHPAATKTEVKEISVAKLDGPPAETTRDAAASTAATLPVVPPSFGAASVQASTAPASVIGDEPARSASVHSDATSTGSSSAFVDSLAGLRAQVSAQTSALKALRTDVDALLLRHFPRSTDL